MTQNSILNAIAKIFTTFCLDFKSNMFMWLLIQFNPTDGGCGLAVCQEPCFLLKSIPMASTSNRPSSILSGGCSQWNEWLLDAPRVLSSMATRVKEHGQRALPKGCELNSVNSNYTFNRLFANIYSSQTIFGDSKEIWLHLTFRQNTWTVLSFYVCMSSSLTYL